MTTLQNRELSARNYDAALGRWFVVDALADEPEQIDKSPYQYAWNIQYIIMTQLARF